MAGNSLSDPNSEEGGGLDVVRRISYSQIRLRGMGTHQDERSRQLTSRRGRKHLRHTVEWCLGVGWMRTSGPEAWTHSGSAGVGAQGDDMAGGRSGNRLSNPNSSEGGRPEDGLRGSKGHLQLWRKGCHNNGFGTVEVLTSALVADRYVGVEENAGATETEYATAASRRCGSRGEGTAGDTSCNRLSDPNSGGGGRPACVTRRTKDHLQPRVMGNHINMLDRTCCRGLKEDVEVQSGAEGDATPEYLLVMDGPALDANPGCDGVWAREDGKVGDVPGSRLSDLNSVEGGRPTVFLGSAKGRQQPWIPVGQTKRQTCRRVPTGLVEAQPIASKSDTGEDWDVLSAFTWVSSTSAPLWVSPSSFSPRHLVQSSMMMWLPPTHSCSWSFVLLSSKAGLPPPPGFGSDSPLQDVSPAVPSP